jgi:hypothetical protein
VVVVVLLLDVEFQQALRQQQEQEQESTGREAEAAGGQELQLECVLNMVLCIVDAGRPYTSQRTLLRQLAIPTGTYLAGDPGNCSLAMHHDNARGCTCQQP